MHCRMCSLCALVVVLAGSAAMAADVRFEDDFDSPPLDPARWTKQEDPGCTVQVSGGVLQALFTGGKTPWHAYAHSVEVALPAGWTSFTLRGQWAYVDKVTGEMLMRLWDADDDTAYVQARYKTYGGEVFNASSPGSAEQEISRTAPATLAPFEWTVTPTGWTFQEYRGGQWDLLADFATAHMAGAEAVRFKLGGWEYSATTLQRTDYDDIELTVLPEPGCGALLLLGAAALVRRRRR